MKKVLIITRHYLNENNGGSNGSKAYIRAFSDIYEDCSLIYPERKENSSKNIIPKNIKLYPCFDNRNYIKKGLDVYRGILHRFPNYVLNHLKKHQYDIIIIDHSITAAGIINKIKNNCNIITIHHNVEHEYLKDNKVSLLYRIPYEFYSKKAEIDAIKFSDINITVTEKDAQSLRLLVPNKSKSFSNMGTFQYVDLPLSIANTQINNIKKFVISGSLNFPQSETPIIEFINKYYPIIEEIVPDAQLIITGRSPSSKIINFAKSNKSIKIIPNPKEIDKIIAQGDVYICPINKGSGVKLRLMDGLKLGMPILTHKLSVNGYETIKKDGFIHDYYDKESFKIALKKILSTNNIRLNIYKSFYNYFSYESGKERLKCILKNNNLI